MLSSNLTIDGPCTVVNLCHDARSMPRIRARYAEEPNPLPPIDTYRNALRAIWERSDYDRGYVANPFASAVSGERGLQRTDELLARLDDPHRHYGIVHVAGSKGKGSTCAMLAAVLRAAGYPTGLYTSPHLHWYRERIAVGGVPIDEATFARLTRRVLTAAERLERDEAGLGRVSAFELLTAMSLLAFAGAGCDLAVVEVGLGGSYDATNVVTPLVAVITRIDLEHTAILGESLPEIAAAKAGIIKPGRPTVTSAQHPDALATIERVAASQDSPLLAGNRDWHCVGTWRGFRAMGPWGRSSDLQLSLAGSHQVENACTVLAALWCLREAGFPVSDQAVRAGFAVTDWPGRFERVNLPDHPPFILDAAHTPAAARALAATLDVEAPDQRAVTVLGTSSDKNPVSIVEALQPVTRVVIATQADHPRASPADQVEAAALSLEMATERERTVAAAIERAIQIAGPGGLVLITGSLYVVAEARVALGLARPDPPITGVIDAERIG